MESSIVNELPSFWIHSKSRSSGKSIVPGKNVHMYTSSKFVILQGYLEPELISSLNYIGFPRYYGEIFLGAYIGFWTKISQPKNRITGFL